MRFVFCFSRSWIPYPTVLGRWARPCWPGGQLRFSIAHFSVKQRSPFRKSFIPSRRQSRHFAIRILANVTSPLSLHAPALGRPAAVVRDRSDVADRPHLQPRRL